MYSTLEININPDKLYLTVITVVSYNEVNGR